VPHYRGIHVEFASNFVAVVDFDRRRAALMRTRATKRNERRRTSTRKGEGLRQVEMIRVISRLESDASTRVCDSSFSSRAGKTRDNAGAVRSFRGDSPRVSSSIVGAHVRVALEFRVPLWLPPLWQFPLPSRERENPSDRFWHIPHTEAACESYPSAPARRLAATCLKFVDLGQFPSLARTLVAPGSRIALSHGIRYPY